MTEFTVSQEYREAYPEATVGVLLLEGASNPKGHGGLEQAKAALTAELKFRYAGFDRAAFKALPIIQAYNAFYKGFGQNYHVQFQIESVVVKGKPIPKVAALVEAMFMAELKNLLLTAGHDADAVQFPAGVDVAKGGEAFVGLGGREQTMKAGDMFISDGGGVLSSVLQGPAQRASIGPGTTRALFTVYAPAGIERDVVRAHLEDIEANVRIVAPETMRSLLEVYSAS
jgi:DNA/RNA-binding domain of Phe-tRNA-synthetase-like protein